MTVELLIQDKLGEFIEYCKKYQKEVDESFLESTELSSYDFLKNLTYIVRENGKISGVSSLMLSDFYTLGKKARFRIFHCEKQSLDIYYNLLKKILKKIEGISELYLFIQENQTILRQIFSELGFKIERYSYVLIKEDLIQPYEFSNDYQVRSFEFDKDEKIWCDVLNASFIHLKGHVSDVTPEMVKRNQLEEGHINGGMLMLYHNDNVIGLVRITKEEFEGKFYACIGPLAIAPKYQKMGLGKNLLRYALTCGENNQLNSSLLTVNGENESAITLYLKEGFKKEEAVVCYTYKI